MASRLPTLLRRTAPIAPILRPAPNPIPHPRLPLPITTLRHAHSIPKPRPTPTASSPTPNSSERSKSTAPEAVAPEFKDLKPRPKRPSYSVAFRCLPCGARSKHLISKQAYHHGSCLVTCPSCNRRHVMSDHLGIFGDRKITVEDLLREKGELVRKGSLGPDMNIEFWPDEKGKVAEGQESVEMKTEEEEDMVVVEDKKEDGTQ